MSPSSLLLTICQEHQSARRIIVDLIRIDILTVSATHVLRLPDARRSRLLGPRCDATICRLSLLQSVDEPSSNVIAAQDRGQHRCRLDSRRLLPGIVANCLCPLVMSTCTIPWWISDGTFVLVVADRPEQTQCVERCGSRVFPSRHYSLVSHPTAFPAAPFPLLCCAA